MDNPIRFIDPDGRGVGDPPTKTIATISDLGKDPTHKSTGNTGYIYQNGNTVGFRADGDVLTDGANPTGKYAQSATALHGTSGFSEGAELNTDNLSVSVIPRLDSQAGKAMREAGVGLGDVALVYNTDTGKSTYSIVGDYGPPTKLGEHSTKALKDTGVKDTDSNTGGVDGNTIYTFIFAGSRNSLQIVKVLIILMVIFLHKHK